MEPLSAIHPPNRNFFYKPQRESILLPKNYLFMETTLHITFTKVMALRDSNSNILPVKHSDQSKFPNFILLPYSTKPGSIFRVVVLAVLLATCSVHAMVRLTTAIINAGDELCPSRQTQLKNALWAFQEFIVASRGSLVLALLWISRKKADCLQKVIDEVLANPKYMEHERCFWELSNISLVTRILSGMLPILMDILWWLSYTWGYFTAESYIYAAIGLHVPYWLSMLYWIICGTFPFVLSQEILRIVFLFGVVFRRGSIIVNRELTKQIIKVAHAATLTGPQSGLQLMESEKEMGEVLVFYRLLVKLVDCFTETFGLTFAAVLGLDISVMLSMVVTGMITAQDADRATRSLGVASDIFGVIVFAIYIGVFTLPMVSAADQVCCDISPDIC